jgi:hypothetical protein
VAGEREGVHLGIGDLRSGGVAAGAEFGMDGQPGAGGGGGMLFTTTSKLFSVRPRQFMVMWENSRCPILFVGA